MYPKRNISAFMFFVKFNKDDVRKELTEYMGERKPTASHIGWRLGQNWENLREEKKIYTDLAYKDRQRYKTEMLNYKLTRILN
tara:strand:- start:424 stop:672 length:249 start_codon:yes stop_codon:yes gene_type:complete